MLGMTFDKNGIARDSGTLLLGVASIIVRLSMGLFVIVVRKVVFEGGPRTMEMGLWLKGQTFILSRKYHKSLNPCVREVGKILKALIIIAVRDLKIKGGSKIIATGQIINQTRLLIQTKVNKRKKLDSAKKHQEISHRRRVEQKISPGMISSADQPIQTYKVPGIFGNNQED